MAQPRGFALELTRDIVAVKVTQRLPGVAPFKAFPCAVLCCHLRSQLWESPLGSDNTQVSSGTPVSAHLKRGELSTKFKCLKCGYREGGDSL